MTEWMHSANHSLGAFCSGGTVANLTALWVARNNLLRPDGEFRGVAREGLYSALKHYQYDGLAILVSDRGHYSLKKSADVLGLAKIALLLFLQMKITKLIVSCLKLSANS